jgi:hypothetical protein
VRAQEISYPDSNRIGKFLILHESLRSDADRPMLRALFGICVPVLDVSEHESGRGRAYIAASELFQPLAEGEEIPEYRIDFALNRPFADAGHEARRVAAAGGFAFVAVRSIVVRAPTASLVFGAGLPSTKLHH